MWTMVLKDGSRHRVSGDIRFTIVGTSKLMMGTLEPIDAVFDAIVEHQVMMVSDLGQVHWITVTAIDASGATIKGVMPPDLV